MDPKNKEKRNYERIGVDCEVHFAPGVEPDKSKRVYLQADVKDLSAEGLSFESAKGFPIGQILHLSLHFLTTNNTLDVRGEVKRCTPLSDNKTGAFNIGVKFLATGKLKEILIANI